MEKLNKLSLPATILIASIILGGFYYASQVSKQKSFEKQQQIELQAKAEEYKTEMEAKKAAEIQGYVAKRKAECYDIEQRERKIYDNVYKSTYFVETDICRILYKQVGTQDYAGKDF